MSTETVDQPPAASDHSSSDAMLSTAAPAASASSPTPKKTKLPLGSLSLRNLDDFVAHLSRCFQTPAGIDTVLLFICYTSHVSASVLETLGAAVARRSAHTLIALASVLPPGTIVFLSKNLPSAAAASLSVRVARHVRALAGLLSETRTIMRLWSLLPLYLWLRQLMTTPAKYTNGGHEKEGEGEDERVEKRGQDTCAAALDRKIAWIQVTACLLLQSLENLYYLASRNVLPLTPTQQAKAAQWSSRFWSVYVGSELGRLAIEALRWREAVRSGRQDVASSEYREWSETWTRTFARQVGWFPLTVHWGMENGFLPNIGVGLLGSIPGIVQMRHLWKQTA